jgi:hypothetical protein
MLPVNRQLIDGVPHGFAEPVPDIARICVPGGTGICKLWFMVPTPAPMYAQALRDRRRSFLKNPLDNDV